MISLYGRLKLNKKVDEIYQAMTTDGIKPDLATYNALLVAYAKLVDTSKVLTLFKQMKDDGIKPDRQTYTTIARMYALVSQEDNLRVVINEMLGQRAHNEKAEKIILDLYIGLGITGSVRDSLERLEMMCPNPTQEIYNAMIRGYDALSNPLKIQELQKEMKAKGLNTGVEIM